MPDTLSAVGGAYKNNRRTTVEQPSSRNPRLPQLQPLSAWYDLIQKKKSRHGGVEQPVTVHPQQLASSYFGPAKAERLRESGGSGTEPFSPTVRLGDSELRVVTVENMQLYPGIVYFPIYSHTPPAGTNSFAY